MTADVGAPVLDVGVLLEQWDRLLEVAVACAERRYGVAPGEDAYQGLYVGSDRVRSLLDHTQTAALVEALDVPHLLPGLDHVQTALVLLVLAPEVDRRYDLVYGYLHDDLARRRPTVGLALDLLCDGTDDRIALLSLLAPGSWFRDAGMVEVDDGPATSSMDRLLRLGFGARRLLLGDDRLDPRLGSATEFYPIADWDLPLTDTERTRLAVLLDHPGDLPLRAQVTGRDQRLLGRIVEAMAATRSLRLIRVDVLEGEGLDRERCSLLCREARQLGALVQLDVAGVLGEGWREAAARLPSVIVTARQPDTGLVAEGFGIIRIGLPPAALRSACWVEAAASVGAELTSAEVQGLAAPYRLTASDISDTVRAAAVAAGAEGRPVPDVADLQAAAGELAGRGIAGVARRVQVNHSWPDLVLPPDSTCQLDELCARVRNREQVLDEWGMSRGATTYGGTHALFSGPSGTGKTAAAQVVAGELGLQLWKVDLARVVSKYVGETEKNLDAIFSAAEHCDVVLFFDEADALFGKRSEVRDAHDRYANIEVSYLLQRMEEHPGLAVLATNLRHNLDEAFLRRLAFDIRFPFPDEDRRAEIWRRTFPPGVELADDVDPPALAAAYTLSGGQIRNVALAAAYLAAQEDTAVGAAHLHAAARREFQKLGKVLDP